MRVLSLERKKSLSKFRKNYPQSKNAVKSKFSRLKKEEENLEGQ